MAQSGGKAMLVMDGQEGKTYDAIVSAPASAPMARTRCRCRQRRKLDRRCEWHGSPAYEGWSPAIFSLSADGQRIGYAVRMVRGQFA